MNNSEIGLLFDMDGVIVDNHKYHFLSWQKLAEKYDIAITEEFYKKEMNGKTFMGIMEVLFKKNISPKNGKRIAIEKEAIYRELYKSQLKPTNGLIDFLKMIKKEGIPMVVGTSAPVENVDFTLDGLSIRSYFNGVVDDRAVTKGKPDPEVYLKCALLAKKAPKNCIVFEDAIAGIKAGKAAGAKVIALATSHKREELEADLIVNNFESINLEVIKEVLSA